MKQLFTIVFLFLFAVCKAQSDINLPNDTIGFSIKVLDSRFREVGYFRYNHKTNRLLTRGNQNKVWGLFTPYLQKLYEVYSAQQEIFKYLDVNGCVTNQEGFDEAMRNYLAVKRKYRM